MVGSGMRRRWNGTSSEERVVSDQRIPISLANYSLDSKSSVARGSTIIFGREIQVGLCVSTRRGGTCGRRCVGDGGKWSALQGYWDSKYEFGEPVASGVYFYALTAGGITATRQMWLRK